MAGQMAPSCLHVEIILLPGGIVSLIGIPTALIGKLITFVNFVAELVEHSALVQPPLLQRPSSTGGNVDLFRAVEPWQIEHK